MSERGLEDADEFGVLVHAFDRKDNEQVRIYFGEFRGDRYVDIRVFYRTEEGFRPTKRGVRVDQELFPELLSGMLELIEVLGIDLESLP